MNLVGHVAVGVRHCNESGAEATSPFVLGCMLPDLAAMARVRFSPAAGLPPAGALGTGVALHHASDAVFHSSPWFRERNLALRDDLLAAGIDRGPARAAAHAGLEMLLDGGLAADSAVAGATADAFAALRADRATADAIHGLVDADARGQWRDRLAMIGRALDPAAYSSTDQIASRLWRMTAGRTRIEIPVDQIPSVATVLAARQREVVECADAVVADVLAGLAR